MVTTLATQLSWSHVVEVLVLKTPEARLFYLGEAATRQLGKRELRRMIDRKAFERKEIANAQLTEASPIALDTFKDPYLLDVLGLREGFLEADLEAAVLRELESFILELGGGSRLSPGSIAPMMLDRVFGAGIRLQFESLKKYRVRRNRVFNRIDPMRSDAGGRHWVAFMSVA